MTIKYAIQDAAPGTLVWLDQDQRDKTAEGACAVLIFFLCAPFSSL